MMQAITCRSFRPARGAGLQMPGRAGAAQAGSIALGDLPYFVYHQIMDVDAGTAVSALAAAIGEPARARMLYCLMDGRARTSTELAMVAEVTPSTASTHLKRLAGAQLVS